MFRKLRDVPECLGNIDGVDYDADILVRITTHEKLRNDFLKCKIDTISFDKTYRVHKVTCYGDPFDVWITNDLGEEEQFGEWIFEDVD